MNPTDYSHQFDFSNIQISGVNSRFIDVKPIIMNTLCIWKLEYSGMTTNMMDKLHYNIFQCVKKMWSEQDIGISGTERRVGLKIDFECGPLEEISYDLISEYTGTRYHSDIRFYSRFGWKISSMASMLFGGLPTVYESCIKSMDASDLDAPFERIAFRDEYLWFWGQVANDDLAAIKITGSLASTYPEDPNSPDSFWKILRLSEF